MYCPMTARQAVMGVESSSPQGPHSQVQNAAAISKATSETPMLRPYNTGSTTLLMIRSSARNRPSTSALGVQPGMNKQVQGGPDNGSDQRHTGTFDSYRNRTIGIRRLLEVPADIGKEREEAVQPRVLRGLAEVMNFLNDVVLIVREILGKALG